MYCSIADGTMEKAGFINMIHHKQNQNESSGEDEGEYTTSKSKCFDRFKDLLDEIRKQQRKVGKGREQCVKSHFNIILKKFDTFKKFKK